MLSRRRYSSNRLFNVKAGTRLVFPEIPCGFDDAGLTYRQYLACVVNSLDELVDAGVLRFGQSVRFLLSALRARQGTLRSNACAVDPDEFTPYDEFFSALSNASHASSYRPAR